MARKGDSPALQPMYLAEYVLKNFLSDFLNSANELTQPFGYNKDLKYTFLAPPYTDIASVQCTHWGKIIGNDMIKCLCFKQHRKSPSVFYINVLSHSRLLHTHNQVRTLFLWLAGRGDCLFLEDIYFYIYIKQLGWQAFSYPRERKWLTLIIYWKNALRV